MIQCILNALNVSRWECKQLYDWENFDFDLSIDISNRFKILWEKYPFV